MSFARSALAALAASATLSMSGTAHAAEVLDAHSGDVTPGAIGQLFGQGFFNRSAGQSFTAEHTGLVSRVIVGAGWFRAPPAGLTASLVQLDAAGLPSTVVASVSATNPVALLSEFMSQPLTFDFTGSGAGVAAGTRYGLVLTAPDCCGGAALADNPYAGGAALVQSDAGTWSEDAASDLLFQVYVNDLPPPPQAPPPSGPRSRDDCKGNGWKAFTNPAFKNQGLCVAYTNKG